jgi:hypothetical protein
MRRLAAAAVLSLALLAPATASAASHICGDVANGAIGQPGPVRVTKGHVSCGEAMQVIRDRHADRHPQQFPLWIGAQTETYIDGWMCNEGHMGVMSCWQGSEYNRKTHSQGVKRELDWAYDAEPQQEEYLEAHSIEA